MSFPPPFLRQTVEGQLRIECSVESTATTGTRTRWRKRIGTRHRKLPPLLNLPLPPTSPPLGGERSSAGRFEQDVERRFPALAINCTYPLVSRLVSKCYLVHTKITPPAPPFTPPRPPSMIKRLKGKCSVNAVCSTQFDSSTVVRKRFWANRRCG